MFRIDTNFWASILSMFRISNIFETKEYSYNFRPRPPLTYQQACLCPRLWWQLNHHSSPRPGLLVSLSSVSWVSFASENDNCTVSVRQYLAIITNWALVMVALVSSCYKSVNLTCCQQIARSSLPSKYRTMEQQNWLYFDTNYELFFILLGILHSVNDAKQNLNSVLNLMLHYYRWCMHGRS